MVHLFPHSGKTTRKLEVTRLTRVGLLDVCVREKENVARLRRQFEDKYNVHISAILRAHSKCSLFCFLTALCSGESAKTFSSSVASQSKMRRNDTPILSLRPTQDAAALFIFLLSFWLASRAGKRGVYGRRAPRRHNST